MLRSHEQPLVWVTVVSPTSESTIPARHTCKHIFSEQTLQGLCDFITEDHDTPALGFAVTLFILHHHYYGMAARSYVTN